jgi:aryl-alcohol dehydrogenase-like predicted oxidoreductase
MRAADERGLRRFAVVENQYSLLCRVPEEKILDACREYEMAFIPYFPLASGLLSGKYRRDRPFPDGSRLSWTVDNRFAARPDDAMVRSELDRAINWHPHERIRVDFDLIEALHDFAESRGRTVLELALGWLAGQQPLASVIVGATSVEQVRSNILAIGCALSPEELAQLSVMTADATIYGSVPIAQPAQ